MSKFLITKKMNLDFFGEAWEDAYLELEAVTTRELKEVFPKLASVDEKDKKSVDEGFDKMDALIKDKFVSGKAPNKKGELIDVQKEDLDDFPAEILSKIVNFLSQGVSTPSKT